MVPLRSGTLKERIGTPNLIVCLDSGCGNYEQLWVTTSLRGVVVGELTASGIREGVHSGDASGIVPSSFRVLRQLLDRIGSFSCPGSALGCRPLPRVCTKVFAVACRHKLFNRLCMIVLARGLEEWPGDPKSIMVRHSRATNCPGKPSATREINSQSVTGLARFVSVPGPRGGQGLGRHCLHTVSVS